MPQPSALRMTVPRSASREWTTGLSLLSSSLQTHSCPRPSAWNAPPAPPSLALHLAHSRVHSTTSPLPVTSSYFLSQTLHEQSRALLSPAYTDMSPLVATGSSTGTG